MHLAGEAGRSVVPAAAQPEPALRGPGGARAPLSPLPAARPFTAEQRAAIADRTGSLLLAANAGSGKTAVMVERFVEAVLLDGAEVGAILALTFTEKAAGELRERVRARFVALGRDELARAAESAWIGTIHGFCAGLLRAHAVAAGLDPGFGVLDEPAARRLHERAFGRALDAWAQALGRPAVDLLAAFPDGALRDTVTAAYGELRSRGQPVGLPLAPAPGDLAERRAALAAARAAAAAALGAVSGAGVQVHRALAALEACAPHCADGAPPPAGALAGAGLPGGAAKALQHPACLDYREALAHYRQGCADHHAASALLLLDDLLRRFAAEAAAAKAARGAVDFEDLQLGVRALLTGDAELRERWARRFALLMVDEFQDTNRVQLELLEALERDNLFVVGDEQQAIYGFRHADVEIFRARRARGRVRTLRTNFRSRPELLAVLTHAFATRLGDGFAPLVPGRDPLAPPVPEGLLFDPDHVPGAGAPAEPAVEVMITAKTGWEPYDEELGLASSAAPPARRAEARAVAARIRAELDAGRRPGDVVVLMRQTAALRLYEQALEEAGVPTYVVGGRGYWSAAPVRDGLAWLSVLANPLDEEALLTVLASPFAGGAATDDLVRLAAAARTAGRPLWEALTGEHAPSSLRAVAAVLAGERDAGLRLGAEALLERALRATGYDLHTLALPGGDRRLANVRKLMRLAREYERAEGRDLRGFLDHAREQDLAQAREGDAPLEADGLDAVRLMTAHRAKGLEFPVVVVADLGRRGRPVTDRLLLGAGGRVGLKLPELDRADPVGAFAYESLAAERAGREHEEEQRLLYVALTRAEERLIVSGVADAEAWPAARPGGEPIHWLAPALAGDPAVAFAAGERVVEPAPGARVRARLVVAGDPAAFAHRRAAPAAGAHPGSAHEPPPAGPTGAGAPHAGGAATAPPAARRPLPVAAVTAPAPPRLSYSALAGHARCGYRWYLERVLRLPPDPDDDVPAEAPAPGALDPRVRGTLVHAVLEAADLGDPAEDLAPLIARAAAAVLPDGEPLSREGHAEVERLARAFTAGPLSARLGAAACVRRELPFAYALAAGPLLTGYVDLLAVEADGGQLVVDFKTDRVEPDADLAALTAERYGLQRLVYALACLHAGAARVEIVHSWLERPAEPVGRTYGAADAPELEAQLRRQAAALLRGEHAPASEPHRELCAGCPGRRSLCHHPRALTGRPRPA